jgi:LuxR family transcriptional regulator
VDQKTFAPSEMSVILRNKLRECRDFQQCLDALHEVASDLGFTQVLYARQVLKPQVDNEHWAPLRLNVRNFPHGWENMWREYECHDPYYHACFDGTLPFDWAKVQSNERLSNKECAAWKYLADFGLARGMTVPIHLPKGKFAVVSGIVDKSNADWSAIYDDNRDNMFHMAHIFHNTITEKGYADQVEVAIQTILSPRECECLGWAALGKTSPEIAMILDRSVETVRLHIKNAMLKLDASTRTHAVAKAVQLGVLEGDRLFD